jgi:hypothetical protein
VGRTRLLIPLVSPKDLLHSPQPFKEALGYIYRQPTKRYLVAKHRGKIENRNKNTKLLDLLLT